MFAVSCVLCYGLEFMSKLYMPYHVYLFKYHNL